MTMNKQTVVSKEEFLVWSNWVAQMADFSKSKLVSISDCKSKRSASQNSLYWTWVTELSRYTGSTEDATHFDLKRRYATRIFMRDDQDYAEMISAVQKVDKSAGFDALKNFVIEQTSTTDFNTRQMGEYMTHIWRMAFEESLPLTDPKLRGLEDLRGLGQ